MKGFDYDEFRSFLESSRKSNGEKLLDKSKSIYIRNIERFEKKLVTSSVEEMISSMNDVLKNNQVANIRSAFKWWLLFYWNLEKHDERFALIRKLDKKASALTSVRMMSNSVIPKKDIKLLFDSVDDDFHRLCFMLLYYGSLRRIEIFSILGKDIEFVDDGNIKCIIRIKGKGDKKRNIFYGSDVSDLIKKLFPDIKTFDKLIEYRMPTGELYRRQDKKMADLFERYTEKFLGDKMHLHQLKHSRLTHLVEEGLDINSVSKIGAHASISTTIIYTKTAANVERNALRNAGGNL